MEWSLRVSHELMYHPYSSFVTLTYEDSFIPPEGLRYAHFSTFMKRLRKIYDKEIRFFMCGEYGEQKGRPHYHALIFGINPFDLENLLEKKNLWDKGLYNVGNMVNNATGAYIAGYVAKKMSNKYYGNGEPPFLKCSKGIGAQYCDEKSKEFLKNGFCELATSKARFMIPRYYFKRLDIDRQKYYETFIQDKGKLMLDEIQRQDGEFVTLTNEQLRLLPRDGEIQKTIDAGYYIELDEKLYVMLGSAKRVLKNMRNVKSDVIATKLSNVQRSL